MASGASDFDETRAGECVKALASYQHNPVDSIPFFAPAHDTATIRPGDESALTDF